MIVGTDVVPLVIRVRHRTNGPTATDDGMCLQQLHRTIGVHLGRNDRTEIVLQINGVDSRLGAICISTYLELTGKLLVLMAVPMKTNTDPDIL